MTLVAAFRARNNGILLCADRKEDDGYGQREIDKIYYIQQLMACQIFITGAGPSEIIKKVNENIHKSFLLAEKGGVNILAEHCSRLEGSLKEVYKEYKQVLQNCPMGLIIVVAPRSPVGCPLLYSTVEYRLSVESTYCAHGSGRPISDYLADSLYKHGMQNSVLALLAAFIFREAERKASGVGLGTDMVFINEGNQGQQEWIGWDEVKQMQADIPLLASALHPCWDQDAKMLGWLKKLEERSEAIAVKEETSGSLAKIGL